MKPEIVFGVYGAALVGPICLFVAYSCWLHNKDKKSPRSTSVKMTDNTSGEKQVNPKFIKVICRE